MRLLHEHSGIAEAKLKATGESLFPALSRLAAAPFFALPADAAALEAVERLVAERVDRRLKYLFLVGVGGSSEGVQAVYEAVRGSQPDLAVFPKIIFLEGLEPGLPAALAPFLAQINSPEEVLGVVISFSGTTLETKLNAEILSSELKRRWPHAWSERLVRISQKAKGELLVPPGLGGRYSLFAPNSLFPLAAVGIDLRALREGAREVSEWLLAPDLSNPAINLAASDYLALEDGRPIVMEWFDRPSLSGLGIWGRQLVAESLGKEGDGPTPVLAVAENDRHSLLQLDLGGPDNKFFHFISFDTEASELARCKRAINEKVLLAYRRAHRPYLEIVLPDLSPRSLGAYCQLRFAATVLEAELLGVNPFDQPDIETYKQSLHGLV